jgi:hypothetical protein
VKRYDCIQFADVCEMRESEDGDYMLHSGHAEAMAGKDAEIAALSCALSDMYDAFRPFANGDHDAQRDALNGADRLLNPEKDTPNAHA